MSNATILVIGSTGKTGKRVVSRLEDRGLAVRHGSRSAAIPFDWDKPHTWAPALVGIGSVYVTYSPDLAVPGSVDAIRGFTELGQKAVVRRLVLLSGRGEEEAERAEDVVRGFGLEWTIVRAAWFAQNFSEGNFLDDVVAGTVALPVGNVREPFVDADDIADVAVAALTEDRHVGQTYELTGPRLLSFADAVAQIATATGRELQFVAVPIDDYAAALAEYGLPDDMIWLLRYLFTTVLDGRNARLADGVQQAMGRAPKDFADYAREAAATGIWAPATDRPPHQRSPDQPNTKPHNRTRWKHDPLQVDS
jgi:uncharacterized protein YbjT (DUF2867 family)